MNRTRLAVVAAAIAWYAFLFWLTWPNSVANGLYFISESPTGVSITTLGGKKINLGPRCTFAIKGAEFYPTEEHDGQYIFRLYFKGRHSESEINQLALCLNGQCMELDTIVGLDSHGLKADFEYTLMSDWWFMTKAGLALWITPWFWYPIHSFFQHYVSMSEVAVFAVTFALLASWFISKTSAWKKMKNARQASTEGVSGNW